MTTTFNTCVADLEELDHRLNVQDKLKLLFELDEVSKQITTFTQLNVYSGTVLLYFVDPKNCPHVWCTVCAITGPGHVCRTEPIKQQKLNMYKKKKKKKNNDCFLC